MSRTAATLLLALALVLAGCAGFTPRSDQQRTDALSPDQEQTRATSTGSSTDAETETTRDDLQPPGVSDGRLADPDALYGAHLAALNDTAYRSAAHATGGVDGEPRTVDVSVLAAEGEAMVNLSTAGVDQTAFTTPDGVYARTAADGTAIYSFHEDGAQGALVENRFLAESAFLDTLLSAGQFEVSGTVAREDGRFVRLRATEIRESTETNITAIDATALVRSDGLVTEFDGTFSEVVGDETTDGEITYEATPVESLSMSRPTWTNEIPIFEAELVGDGRLVRLEHQGGPRLGEFASIRVERNGVLAQGVTSESLEPGGTLYLYTTGDGPAAQLSFARERPEVTGEFRQFDPGSLTVAVDSGTRRATLLATRNATG